VQAVEYQLQPGDVLVLYTDGVTEAENVHAEPFGTERLSAIVQASAGLSARTIKDRIIDAVEAFMGDTPPFDDTTLVVIRYTGT